ncbi:MAG: M55 family metallopeptidase [Chloroflexota bacterium]|nr:MAG: peptidase M55 [Chloroflexota bacterium]
MDVYISADVEGVAGVVDRAQIMPGENDYAIGRSLMTEEANAAIDGAFAAGATRVVVNDAHARMSNLLPDAVDLRANLILGKYKPMYMLQGLDSTFDAAFFVGYHGSIGEPEAILSHTYNPRAIWETRVDGNVVGELGINVLVCDYYGVPLRLVTGDQAVAAEARASVAGVHVAEVKRSFGRFSAESLSPSRSRDLIQAEARSCLQSIPTAKAVRRAVTVELTFLVADMASMAEWIRGVKRCGARTVSFDASDGLEAYRTFYTIITLTRGLVD